MASSDYRRMPGTAARYVKVSGPGAGETISKRAHDTMRAQEAGFRDVNQYRKVSKNPEYLRHLGQYAGATGERRKDLKALKSEFNRLWTAAYLRPDGTVRTANETSREAGRATFDLLYTEGFVRGEDYQRYLKG